MDLKGKRLLLMGGGAYVNGIKKYADEKVDNHDALESMVDPKKMLEAMNDVAMVQRNMFALSQKLQSTCYAINAKAARYKKTGSD